MFFSRISPIVLFYNQSNYWGFLLQKSILSPAHSVVGPGQTRLYTVCYVRIWSWQKGPALSNIQPCRKIINDGDNIIILLFCWIHDSGTKELISFYLLQELALGALAFNFSSKVSSATLHRICQQFPVGPKSITIIAC